MSEEADLEQGAGAKATVEGHVWVCTAPGRWACLGEAPVVTVETTGASPRAVVQATAQVVACGRHWHIYGFKGQFPTARAAMTAWVVARDKLEPETGDDDEPDGGDYDEDDYGVGDGEIEVRINLASAVEAGLAFLFRVTVTAVLWALYAVPLGAPPLSFGMAAGLCLLTSVLLRHPTAMKVSLPVRTALQILRPEYLNQTRIEMGLDTLVLILGLGFYGLDMVLPW